MQRVRAVVQHRKFGLGLATVTAAVIVATALAITWRLPGPPLRPPIEMGVVAAVGSILAFLWALWGTYGRGSESAPPRLKGRRYASQVCMLLGTGCMAFAMVGITLRELGILGQQPLVVIQVAGLITYPFWAAALFALPTHRTLSKRKLPWVLDVTMIVTAISAAGWFFLIAPQVNLNVNQGIWLTLMFPLMNLVSIASVVASIALGGPFRSARGLLMLGITINVAGDALQAVMMVNQKPVPVLFINSLWIASTLLVGLAALQVRFDAETPSRPTVERHRRFRLLGAVTPVLFLSALIALQLWGNWQRPGTNDVIVLTVGTLIAMVCCLLRLLYLIKDNQELTDSLAQTNENLDRLVQERTTELIEARDDLERQKQFLRTVIDALPSLVVAQGEDGTILLANRNAAKLYGRSVDDFQGLSAEQVASIGARLPGLVGTDIRSILFGGRAVTHEMQVSMPDGTERTLEIVKTPVPGKSGVPDQVLIVGNDVTLRKEAERTLIAARDAAEQSTRTKTEFLANMSHELRTPLNGVVGLSEILLEESLTDSQRELAQNIKSSGESLLGLVNDVLDLAKLDSGQTLLEESAVSLARLCADVVDSYRQRAGSRGLDLRADVHLDPNARFMTDIRRVRQILGHLLANAIRFTERGTVSLDVDVVHGGTDASVIRFAVRDTGMGIPHERHEEIFEPFRQIDNSLSRRYGGAGLGLSLSRRYAQLLEGSLTVQSEPGVGSVFTLELPLRHAPEEPVRVAEQLSALAGLSVLVVEDNRVNQMVLKRLLERLGCAVSLASNGQEAVEWLLQRPCDLVLMDCQMPVMDGLEATRRIRHLDTPTRAVPIVAVTANAMTGDREKCLAAGMDDYVPKPIKPEVLTGTLSRLVLSSAA